MNNTVLKSSDNFYLAPHRQPLTQEQLNYLIVSLYQCTNTDLTAVTQIILQKLQTYKIEALKCINLEYKGNDKYAREIPYIPNAIIVPSVDGKKTQVIYIEKNKRNKAYIRFGHSEDIQEAQQNKSELLLKTMPMRKEQILEGKSTQVPIIKFSQLKYETKYENANRQQFYQFYPVFIATDSLVTIFTSVYDKEQNRIYEQQFDVMNLDAIEETLGEDNIPKIVVDAQFDSGRQGVIWILYRHVNPQHIVVQSLSLDFIWDQRFDPDLELINEEHLICPQLLKKENFIPECFTQFINQAAQSEYLILQSSSRFILLSRPAFPAYNDQCNPQQFTPAFIFDYMDSLGIKRLLNPIQSYIDSDTYKYLEYIQTPIPKLDTIKDYEMDEFEQLDAGIAPFNRRYILDCDQHFFVLPDFLTKQQNIIQVCLTSQFDEFVKLALNFDKEADKQKDMPYQMSKIFQSIQEEGPTLEESLVNGVELFPKRQPIESQQKRNNLGYQKLLLVSTIKSVSIYIINYSESAFTMSKAMNVVPFTQLCYLDKFQLARCQLHQESDEKIYTYCFTTTSKVFRFEIKI